MSDTPAARVAADLRVLAEAIPDMLRAKAEPTQFLLQLVPRLLAWAQELDPAPARALGERRGVAQGDDRLWRER